VLKDYTDEFLNKKFIRASKSPARAPHQENKLLPSQAISAVYAIGWQDAKLPVGTAPINYATAPDGIYILPDGT
jgi:hypothetical protein